MVEECYGALYYKNIGPFEIGYSTSYDPNTEITTDLVYLMVFNFVLYERDKEFKNDGKD